MTSRCGWRRTASPSSASRRRRSPGACIPKRVTLYHAAGCSLCGRAREQLLRVRDEEPFELEEVDIGGDSELEARYREWLPVVEIDGERAFTYFVFEDRLLHKLRHG